MIVYRKVSCECGSQFESALTEKCVLDECPMCGQVYLLNRERRGHYEPALLNDIYEAARYEAAMVNVGLYDGR
jgi:hypothetical protein